MLAAILFGIIFMTGVWSVFAVHAVIMSLSGMTFLEAGLTNMLIYVLFVCFPIFILWTIFGSISQYLYNRSFSKQMFRLFSQQKKMQEYSDLLARIMLETEQNTKDFFMLNRFDLLVADMNELLSELLQRERFVSAEQIESLWNKVQNGGKWSFGKVLIENYNRQPAFQKRIFADAATDNMLAGTIMEFCARYQSLLSLLEKHDKEKMFLNVIETGVLGKVFAILAPVADELHRSKESLSALDFVPDARSYAAETRAETTMNGTEKKFFGESSPSENEFENDQEKDAFSLALERSFGKENSQEKREPVFGRAENKPFVSNFNFKNEPSQKKEYQAETNNTQETLNALKEEWRGIGDSSDKIEKDNEELTYPFGGWVDADNYKK